MFTGCFGNVSVLLILFREKLQADGKCTALSRGGLYFDHSPGDIKDPLHQSQAQTVALSRAGCIALIKFVADMFGSFRTHAAARIAHHDDRFIAIRFQEHADLPSGLRKLERIGQEIVPHDAEQLPVGNDLDLVSDIRVDPDLFLFPDRLESQQTFRQLPAEIETLTVSSDLLVLQPAEPQDIRDHRT